MSGKKIIYLDSCILISWVTGEFHSTDDEDGVREVFRRMEAGEIVLATSTVTLIEVLSQTFRSEKDELDFETALQHPNFRLESVTPVIARKAKELREFTPQSALKKGLSTPDAIHVATALFVKADQLYTTDEGRNGKSVGLLSLEGEGLSLPVKVCRPVPPIRLSLFSASSVPPT